MWFWVSHGWLPDHPRGSVHLESGIVKCKVAFTEMIIADVHVPDSDLEALQLTMINDFAEGAGNILM